MKIIKKGMKVNVMSVNKKHNWYSKLLFKKKVVIKIKIMFIIEKKYINDVRKKIKRLVRVSFYF